MNKPRKQEEKDEPLNLEELLLELEGVIEKLEDKALPLEESFVLYEEGIKKLKQCNSKIDRVEKKVKLLSVDGFLEESEYE